MKETLMDKVDRHIIYFLSGMVAVISATVMTTFLYMLLLPIMIFGGYYLMILPPFLFSVYYIGRRIMNEKDNRKEK